MLGVVNSCQTINWGAGGHNQTNTGMYKIHSFWYFLKVIWQQRYIIRKLVARDFKKKYLGSYFGVVWAFMEPASFIFAIWFVVSIGLRGGGWSDVAFLPWLISAMIPWFFIRDGWTSASGSLHEYSFLIKKMYFRVGIIPVIKISTMLIVHLFMLFMLLIILLLYDIRPSIYWIQIPYYLVCSLVLLIGLGWISSALTVFVRDVLYVIGVITTLLFWLSAIIWPHQVLEGKMRYFVELNPVFYITNGYREALLYGNWFYANTKMTLFFWVFAITIFTLGALVFQKLKPHFADVL